MPSSMTRKEIKTHSPTIAQMLEKSRGEKKIVVVALVAKATVILYSAIRLLACLPYFVIVKGF